MLYKYNVFDLVVLLWSVFFFIFATTSHVNHCTSLDPASLRDQANFKLKMEDVSVEADKNVKSNRMFTSLGKNKGL